MITWIIEKVAIGEYLDSKNEEMLRKEGIDCILSLRVIEPEVDLSWYFEYLMIDWYRVPVGYCPLHDPIKTELKVAAYMLQQLTKKYSKIMVHCTAGMDRAPFVVALWLSGGSKSNHLRMIDAYKFIKEKRPQIREHMEWV